MESALYDARMISDRFGGVILHVVFGNRLRVEVLPRNVESIEAASRRAAASRSSVSRPCTAAVSIAQRLKAQGVTQLFTLSGGHLFSIYDGCREEGIDIVDVRHEQSAALAAEGGAKPTTTPALAG